MQFMVLLHREIGGGGGGGGVEHRETRFSQFVVEVVS